MNWMQITKRNGQSAMLNMDKIVSVEPTTDDYGNMVMLFKTEGREFYAMGWQEVTAKMCDHLTVLKKTK